MQNSVFYDLLVLELSNIVVMKLKFIDDLYWGAFRMGIKIQEYFQMLTRTLQQFVIYLP